MTDKIFKVRYITATGQRGGFVGTMAAFNRRFPRPPKAAVFSPLDRGPRVRNLNPAFGEPAEYDDLYHYVDTLTTTGHRVPADGLQPGRDYEEVVG